MSSVDRLLEQLPMSGESRRKVTRDTEMDHRPHNYSSEVVDHQESPQLEGENQQMGNNDRPNVVSILQKSAGSGKATSKGLSNATPNGHNCHIGLIAALSRLKTGRI